MIDSVAVIERMTRETAEQANHAAAQTPGLHPSAFTGIDIRLQALTDAKHEIIIAALKEHERRG